MWFWIIWGIWMAVWFGILIGAMAVWINDPPEAV